MGVTTSAMSVMVVQASGALTTGVSKRWDRGVGENGGRGQRKGGSVKSKGSICRSGGRVI